MPDAQVTSQVVDEESAVMNSSTMCILACIAAVLAVNGPGGAWGRVGELAASASRLAVTQSFRRIRFALHAVEHAKP